MANEVVESLQSEDAAANAYFVQMVEGYRSARIVFTGVSLGIFTALAEGPRSSEEVASSLSLDARGTRILLRALTALDLLVLTGDGQFSNGRMADVFLVKGRPKYVGENIAFHELTWPLWSDLNGTVRRGRPQRALMELLSESDSSFTQNYVRGMVPVSRIAAGAVARILADKTPTRMLDVGAGPGAYAAALMDRLPALNATMLDLPRTLEVTRELVAPPHRDRVRFVSGDYHEADFGSGYDLVLMSHITHDESAQANVRLFQKAYEALAPGGTLAIHDFLVDDTGTRPRFSALFSVHMLVYTSGGETYSFSEYASWMKQAGFENIENVDVSESAVGNRTHLVLGRKR